MRIVSQNPATRRRLGLAAGAVLVTTLALSGCTTETVVRLPEEPTFAEASPSSTDEPRVVEEGDAAAIDCAGGPIEVLSGATTGVEVAGECPTVTIRGNDLTVDMTGAVVDDVVVRADRVTVHASDVRSLSIDGYDTVVDLDRVADVAVSGDRNTVRAAGGIDAVSVDGDDNIIRAETGIDLIDDAGERNTIG